MNLQIKKASTRRVWLLNGFLIAVFTTAMAIPVHPVLLPAAVTPKLPYFIGDWIGKEDSDTSAEEAILAEDTKILKANYTNNSGDFVQASLVISGSDLNNSIHRPERCLLAQGHTNISRDSFLIEADNNLQFPVSRLVSTKKYTIDEETKVVSYQTYYWFVGHETVTNSHYKRSFIDIFDRLTGGTAQQWAYISVSAPVAPDDAESQQEMLEAFVKQLAARITTLDAPR